MSRLNCEAKLGFYPTDLATLKKIIAALGEQKNDFFVCDPCCGKGEALASLAKAFNATSFGVELDEERAKESASRCDVFVCGDSLRMIKSHHLFGLLYLNPPYGEIKNEVSKKTERLELRFLQYWGSSVSNGGLCLLVINPSSISPAMAYTMRKHGLVPVAVFYDNNKEYEAFKQYFILLVKDKEKAARMSDSQVLELIQPQKAEPLDSIVSFGVKIPKNNKNQWQFRGADELPQWQIESFFTKSKLAQKPLKGIAKIGGSKRVECVQPPNKGQSALLVGAGLITDEIGGYLIKGKAEKTLFKTGETTDNKDRLQTQAQEQYVAKIYGFCLADGVYVEFE